MHGSVWILDADEGDRTLAAVGLAQVGVSTLEFSSATGFLSHARHGGHELPPVAVIDAATALGRERDIRDAVYARLVVLTTGPSQVAAWLNVGASRFLPKPVDLDCLVEHVDPDGFLVGGRAMPRVRRRVDRGRAS